MVKLKSTKFSLFILLGVLLWIGGPWAQAQDVLSQDQVVAQLKGLQDQVKMVASLYPEAVDETGQIIDQVKYDQVLVLARQVRDAFGSGEDSPLLDALQAISLPVAEQVRAQAALLLSVVLDVKPPSQVDTLISQLLPGLNRAVIIAQGKVFPKNERQLKTAEAINAAVDGVLALAQQALELYQRGDVKSAARANDAFFMFESSGVGADVTLLDEDLENEVESDISAFGPTAEADPGLEQLIEQGASLEVVQAQLERVRVGMETVRALLLNTLPKSQLGDVNGDGRITITDALLIAQAALGLRTVDPQAADVNGDGRITITDALLVAQAALGVREL